jgi:hypothetical protein
MKVKKAIKRIAALGIGASMFGATLMGAMAADLGDYPGMFVQNGQFDGLLVVGKNANAIDTIGVTNIALGLQKAAVTETTVCGSSTASRTTVSGEEVQIEKTGDDLNIGEDIQDIQGNALDDGDLPSILADGNYDESEGETDNDVSYTQEITLVDGAGEVVYAQDDQDAPDAGVYLYFPRNVDAYTYTLEFDTAVEWDAGQDDAADFKSTILEIQGQKYTVTSTDFATDNSLDKLTLLVGESVLWIAEGEVVTKEVDGVDHTIKMIDVANDASSCGFEVDGSRVWVDVDETETISGVTLGVTEARAVNNDKSDADICKVYIGAEELVLEDGQEVEIGGDAVDGSNVVFTSDGTAGEWDSLEITWAPDDDMYLAAGDEMVDPVFGNFKFIMGGEVVEYEDIVVDVSGNDATVTFLNFDGDEIEVPYAMDETTGDFVLGTDPDLTTNPDEGFYLEGMIAHCGANDLPNCEGLQFLAIDSGDVAHVLEITDIDEDDQQIDFDDITTGSSDDNNDYENDGSDSDISIGQGVGTITLVIDEAAGTIEFDTIDLSVVGIKTVNEGVLDFADANNDTFTFVENDEEDNEATLTVEFAQDAAPDDDQIKINTPSWSATGGSGQTDFGPVAKSDDDDDTQYYYTYYGSLVEYDSNDERDLTIMHPEEQLVVDAFIAESSASASTTDGSSGDCVISTTLNPIPSTVNKFDTEISNPGAQNLISVGGPCANSVSSALLGNPEVCYEGFEEGKALLKLVESGNNVALVVAGGTGRDTQLASRILQEYEDYSLSGMEMVATTVSESGLSVQKVS